MTDPATTMLPIVDPDPGSEWFEPPLEATTQLAVVDRRPSPVPRDEPAAVRPYIAQPVDVPAPQHLAPLQVEIRAIHPDALADLAMALRPLLYEQLPTDGRVQHGQHGERRRDPAPDFRRPDIPAAHPPLPTAGGDTNDWPMCPTPGCAQRAGHPGPCDRAAAAHDNQEA